MQVRVLAFVLAGGKGTRLYPLTKERAKPAVSFGGRYRIVDFVLATQNLADIKMILAARDWAASGFPPSPPPAPAQ